MFPQPPASTWVQDLVYAYMPAQALGVAARLGIADELAGGSRTLEELAGATDTHAPSLRRLLHALACVGIVAEPENDTFELTPGGQVLRADRPDSIKAAVELFTSDEVWRSWGQLEYSVRTGKIAWDHVIGMSVFDYMGQHSDWSGTFNAAMGDRTRAAAAQIVASYDFSPFDTLVDVGGGDGSMISTILAAVPELRGVLFDRPAGVADGAATLRAAGVADRCEIVSGDFFVAVPEGAAAYVVKRVLQNWDDEQCVTILRNCREAMRPDGTLLVIERVLPPRIESPEAGRVVFMDLNMLVHTHGRERTEAEFRSLYAAAGFELVDSVATEPDPFCHRVLVGVPV
jgi:orsellinic acid C2-O-methyltransferase